ncbi:MAG: hypothetical protein P8P30_11070 [Rickettsiales bacterium]|nr:hypothetical protein [Rickettsiales bacterium]
MKLLGKSAWYVFEVASNKRILFEKRFYEDTPLTLSDYGITHHSGWGDEPPAELKLQLQEKYGLYQ